MKCLHYKNQMKAYPPSPAAAAAARRLVQQVAAHRRKRQDSVAGRGGWTLGCSDLRRLRPPHSSLSPLSILHLPRPRLPPR